MARYRHWKNHGEGGDCLFVTTTALDFAHVFESPIQKSLLLTSILSDCLQFDASMHAYVAMANHIHLLLTLPGAMNATEFVRVLKANAADNILPTLSDDQKQALGAQTGLNRRRLWKAGFRGVPILSGSAFRGKVGYIHTNPVRAGLCQVPHEYRWSSAHAFHGEAFDEFQGLSLEKALELYHYG